MDVKATDGDTMLDLAQRYDIELECKQKHKRLTIVLCLSSFRCL